MIVEAITQADPTILLTVILSFVSIIIIIDIIFQNSKEPSTYDHNLELALYEHDKFLLDKKKEYDEELQLANDRIEIYETLLNEVAAGQIDFSNPDNLGIMKSFIKDELIEYNEKVNKENNMLRDELNEFKKQSAILQVEFNKLMKDYSELLKMIPHEDLTVFQQKQAYNKVAEALANLDKIQDNEND